MYKLLPIRAARYDRQLAAIARRVLRPNSNTVDIGAHRGAVLADFLRLAPLGTHFAIEPVPEHAQYLVKRFPAARVLALALSDAPGEGEFFHVVTRPTRSGLRRVEYPSRDEQVVPIVVPIARLDDVIPADLCISLIKVDVEGGEFGVLAGGMELIRRDRPMIVFEHGLLAERHYSVPSSKIYSLLADDLGYKITTMKRWLEGRGGLGQADFENEVRAHGGHYFVAYG